MNATETNDITMKSNEGRRYETPGAIRHDARTLAEDARALLDATSEVADEKIAAARERLADALASGKQTYARLQQKVVDSAKVADQAVRSHPYQSIGVGFGVGILVGMLISRRGE
jgi:ElaB/YqjD/DUF883 family membrane-anchored ribosome-binding protein